MFQPKNIGSSKVLRSELEYSNFAAMFQAHDKDREKKLAMNKLIEGNVQKSKMEEKMKVCVALSPNIDACSVVVSQKTGIPFFCEAIFVA